MSQVQRICFTYIASIWGDDNKFTPDADKLLDWLDANSKFCRIGVEHAPTTGAIHWQGYAELKKRWRMAQLCKLGMRWHVEACKGNQADNLAYCAKENCYIDHGVFEEQAQGKRNDLESVRSVLASSGVRGVAAAGASLHQIKYAEKLVGYLEEERDWQPIVIYIQGASGVGKSSLACDIAEMLFPGRENRYTKSSNNKWFDGYDAHPVVILDDWRDSWWPLTYTLGLTDRYACRIECKGGSRQLLARVIIITSVKDFVDVYKGCESDGEPVHQFRRRFTHVITLKSPYKNIVRCAGGWGNNRTQPLAQENLQNMNMVDSVLTTFLFGVGVHCMYKPCEVLIQPEEEKIHYASFGRKSLFAENEEYDEDCLFAAFQELTHPEAYNPHPHDVPTYPQARDAAYIAPTSSLASSHAEVHYGDDDVVNIGEW